MEPVRDFLLKLTTDALVIYSKRWFVSYAVLSLLNRSVSEAFEVRARHADEEETVVQEGSSRSVSETLNDRRALRELLDNLEAVWREKIHLQSLQDACFVCGLLQAHSLDLSFQTPVGPPSFSILHILKRHAETVGSCLDADCLENLRAPLRFMLTQQQCDAHNRFVDMLEIILSGDPNESYVCTSLKAYCTCSISMNYSKSFWCVRCLTDMYLCCESAASFLSDERAALCRHMCHELWPHLAHERHFQQQRCYHMCCFGTRLVAERCTACHSESGSNGSVEFAYNMHSMSWAIRSVSRQQHCRMHRCERSMGRLSVNITSRPGPEDTCMRDHPLVKSHVAEIEKHIHSLNQLMQLAHTSAHVQCSRKRRFCVMMLPSGE